MLCSVLYWLVSAAPRQAHVLWCPCFHVVSRKYGWYTPLWGGIAPPLRILSLFGKAQEGGRVYRTELDMLRHQNPIARSREYHQDSLTAPVDRKFLHFKILKSICNVTIELYKIMHLKINSRLESLMTCSENKNEVELKGCGQDNVKQNYFSIKNICGNEKCNAEINARKIITGIRSLRHDNKTSRQ